MGLVGKLIGTALVVGALAVGGSVVALRSCSDESISYTTKLPSDDVKKLRKSVNSVEDALGGLRDTVKDISETYKKEHVSDNSGARSGKVKDDDLCMRSPTLYEKCCQYCD
jgi:hypothetical protein